MDKPVNMLVLLLLLLFFLFFFLSFSIFIFACQFDSAYTTRESINPQLEKMIKCFFLQEKSLKVQIVNLKVWGIY
jgi:hypothetical protein